MASYRALVAAGRSIVDLLNRRFVEQLPAPPRPTAVLAGTADFNQVNSSPVAVIQYPAVLALAVETVDAVTHRPMQARAGREVPLLLLGLALTVRVGVELLP